MVGSLPLTWGQLHEYDWQFRNGFNIRGAVLGDIWFTPVGTRPETVTVALDTIVGRHDTLRTVFDHGNVSPGTAFVSPGTAFETCRNVKVRQIVLDRATPSEVSVVYCAPNDLARVCYALQDAAHTAIFNPSDPSPLKATIVLSGGSVRAVVVHVPHVTVDHSGLVSLKNEFLTLITQCNPASVDALPKVRQPRDQVIRESAEPMQLRARQARNYIASLLADAPTVLLSTGRPRAEQVASRANRSSRRIVTSAVQLARISGLSVPSVLLGAVALLIAAHTGSDQVVLRSPFSRKHIARSETYVAPQNLAALIRTQVYPDQSLHDFLRAAASAALRGYVHTDYNPRDLLVEQALAGRSRGITVDGWCQYNFMGTPRLDDILAGSLSPTAAERLERPGLPPDDPVVMPLDMQFIINLAAGFIPGVITVSVTSDDIFLGVSAGIFIDEFERLLQYAATDIECSIPNALEASGLPKRLRSQNEITNTS